MKYRNWAILAGCWLTSLIYVEPAAAFYNPQKGRWLNRDPIEERQIVNLVSFTRNAPLGSYDVLGKAVHEIVLITFIEAAQVTTPWPYEETFAGDNRSFGNGSFRTIHRFKLDPFGANNGYVSGTEYKDTGVTELINPSTGEVLRTGKASTTGLTFTLSRMFNCVIRYEIRGQATNPIASGYTPPIDYFLYGAIRGRVGSRPGRLTFNVEHDQFPAYDFYLDGTPFYQFSAVTAGTSPYYLLAVYPNETSSGSRNNIE